MMKHAYGPYFDFVRKTGVEPRYPTNLGLGVVVSGASSAFEDGNE